MHRKRRLRLRLSCVIGETVPIQIEPTDGDNTNFLLGKGNHGVGFYRAKSGLLDANKTYLQLPTSEVPNNAGGKGLTMVFDFDDEGVDPADALAKSWISSVWDE